MAISSSPTMLGPVPAGTLDAGIGRRRSRTRLRPGLVLAGAFVLLLVVAAIAPGLLTSIDPLDAVARQAYRAPDALHWLGTDENGRDVLSRLIHGVRPSLLLGLAATAMGLALGTLLGVVGGIAIAYNVDVIVPFIERMLGVHFLPREVYFISALPSDPQMGDIATIGLTSLVLSLLATLYPSWRASRLQPAQVLRHD